MVSIRRRSSSIILQRSSLRGLCGARLGAAATKAGPNRWRRAPPASLVAGSRYNAPRFAGFVARASGPRPRRLATTGGGARRPLRSSLDHVTTLLASRALWRAPRGRGHEAWPQPAARAARFARRFG